MVVFDRGFTDYDWFYALDRNGVCFFTRMKGNADYGVVERRAVPQRGPAKLDEIIFLCATCSCAASRSGTRRSSAPWCSSPMACQT